MSSSRGQAPAFPSQDMHEPEHFLESIATAGGKELLEAVEAEFRLGWQREKVMTQMEQQRMSEACTRLESAAVDGLGYIEADIPAASYFYWLHEGRQRGTNNIWRHKEFRRDFLRDNPQFRVKYRNPKPRTAWTPPMDQAPQTSKIVTGSKYGMEVAA